MKIVLDPFNSYSRKIFSYEEAKRNFIGATWIPLLYHELKERGIEMVLANNYLSQQQFSSEDFVISEGVTPLTSKLLSTSAQPLIVLSGESPNVDWKFYAFLKKITERYKYAILFAGCQSYVHTKTKFFPFCWPNDSRGVNEIYSWPLKREKKLVMVVGNKKQSSVKDENRLKSWIKAKGMKLATTAVPSLKLEDLYSFRMEAIKYFSQKNYFDLYGRHWNNHSNLTEAEKKAIIKLAPKEVDNKYNLLCRYEFALCFENCIYPGYITEKIFDCFMAGCIPVYYGAPDIERFIPENLFIDMRSFKNFDALAAHIQSINEDEQEHYRKRISEYLKKEEFQKFTDRFFSKMVFGLIEKELSKSEV